MRFVNGTVLIERISKLITASEDVLMLDVLSLSADIEKEIVVETLSWEGKPLRVVDRPSLARLKMLRGNPQDIVDLEKLK